MNNPLHPIFTGKSGQEWTGLHGSSLSLAVSQLARQLPLVIITADTLTTERLLEDIAFFADISTTPSTSTKIPLFTFPDWETLPYDAFSPHPDIISERLATLFHLPTMTQGVLVLPITTLMYRLAPTHYVQSQSIFIRQQQRLNLEQFKHQLIQGGYQAVSQVAEHGEFAVRGSLLDLFPMGSEVPYRIDLFDDEVDSIRCFDPETQLSQQTVAEIRLLPAREFSLEGAVINHFRTQWRSQFGGDPMRSPIYRDVSKGFASAGIEYYLPLFFTETHTLFDYLPSNSVILTVGQEIHATAERFWQEIKTRYEQLRHDIERPLLPPTQLFLQANEIFAAFGHYSQVRLVVDEQSATEISTPSQKQGTIGFATEPLPYLAVEARAAQPLGQFASFLQHFSGRVLLTAETTGRRESLLELLRNHGLNPTVVGNWQDFLQSPHHFCITVAPLEQGFVLKGELPPNPLLVKEGELTTPLTSLLAKEGKGVVNTSFIIKDEIGEIAVISETQLLGERVAQRRLRKKTTRDLDAVVRNLTELNIGSPVVHEECGVGRYQGLVTLEIGGIVGEFLLIEYANQDKLYVPVSSLHLISRFTGIDPEHAPLYHLGSNQWEKAKRKAVQQIHDIAAELLDLHARRAARQGHAFNHDAESYQIFAQAFPFEETPDQQEAIDAVLADMYAPRAMDRLVCGDVGFGKTEVAMRAAFVAVQDGQQVAILVPTTLLAQQHYQTFQDRFSEWPIRIESLSRFNVKKQQGLILTAIAEGKVDIVIGTHKLLQDNLRFKRLGLVIIDEEHRFGVQQKERFKSLRTEVDILTLTATPIPRSLSMALSNLRDLSIIATPPSKRLAVKTVVMEWYAPVLTEALSRELKRGGQVYFLHNDIETIEKMAREIKELAPEAHVRIANGQMPKKELEHTMRDFYHRRFNVLVCTTIIESGIDVPTANTIIINRADRFGLAQLYQLRGRVGRSHHRAYAYLITPPRKVMTPDAVKRLDAISALEELGVGFTLATHDLEIRGAGELLGKEQSGHIQEIGYTLYTELLERAVQALKTGQKTDLERPLAHGIEINLHSPALIPSDYLPDVHARLILYKRIASAANETALDELQVEMIDRFGLLPEVTKSLFKITSLKLKGIVLGIRKIDLGIEGGYLLFHEQLLIDPAHIVELLQSQPRRYRLDHENRLRLLGSFPDFTIRWHTINEILNRLT